MLPRAWLHNAWLIPPERGDTGTREDGNTGNAHQRILPPRRAGTPAPELFYAGLLHKEGKLSGASENVNRIGTGSGVPRSCEYTLPTKTFLGGFSYSIEKLQLPTRVIVKMFHRQRMLLGLIDLLEELGRPNKLTLVKMLFLLAKEHPPKFSMYGFHPYIYGPFSAKLYSDLSHFCKKGYIEERGNTVHILEEGRRQERLEPHQEAFVKGILEKYPGDNALIDYIHGKYPKYTVRSQRRNVPNIPPLETEPGYFLIGYEGRSIDDFLRELVLHNIHVLVDVRRNARSRKYEFNKGRLEKAVNNLDIEYRHVPELGIAPGKRKKLETKMDYELLFAEYAKQLPNKGEYIEQIEMLGKKRRIALMCFEADVQSCHRREIGKVLVERGHVVSNM